MFKRVLFAVFLVFSLLSAIPHQINYQGKITDETGVALNGYYNMDFSIYDAETGGTLQWTESHTSVPVSKGLFNVILGSSTPINLSFDTNYWLEIQVNGDVLTPRIPLSSSAYAFRASIADSAVNGGGQVLTMTFGSDDTLRLTQTVGSDLATQIPVDNDDLSDNVISDLSDVNTSGVSSGQVLKWNSSTSRWEPANDDTGSGGGSGSSQWIPAATYIYPDSVGDASGQSVRIYDNGRIQADASSGISGGQSVIRGDASGTVWGALGYYDGTNYRAGEFSGDIEIVNSGNLYVSGQIYDGDASDPDVNIGEDLTVSGNISGNGDISGQGDLTMQGSASIGAAGFGFLNMNSNRIVNVADPTANQDAATKYYVDNNFLQTVATSSPITGDGTSGSPISLNSGGITTTYLADNAVTTAKISDGQVTAAKISSSGGSNGQVLKIVSGAVQWANDSVGGGSSGVNSVTAGYGLTNSGTSSDPVLDINAGDGLGISSDNLNVNVDGVTIEIASDQLRVPAGGIGATQLADAAVTGVKIAQMGASNGQVLKWNGSNWAPADDDTGTGGGSSGITSINSQSGPSITITNGTGISVSSGSNIITITNTGDTDASDDLTQSTSFSGDVSGIYSNLQLGSGVVGDNEMNYSQVTLSDFTNDAGFITSPNDADANSSNELITSFTWTDSNDSLQITEAGVTRYVTIDNEADDVTLADVQNACSDDFHNIGGTDAVNDADHDATNEIQTENWNGSGSQYLLDLSLTSNDAALRAGTGINFTLTGDTLVIVNSGDLSTTNELQNLFLSGTDLWISLGDTVHFTGWDTNASNDLTTSTTFSGDVSGTYNSLNINSGVVGNTEIADATQFVDVYTNGTLRFSVSDGSQTLDFNEGIGIDISYSASGHDITITHQDMSSQSSMNNSDGTVIQDVTLDWSGHVTGLGLVNLDNRYSTGSGTSGRAVRWTGTRSLGNSAIYDDGADNIAVGTNYNSNYRIYGYYNSNYYGYLGSASYGVYGYGSGHYGYLGSSSYGGYMYYDANTYAYWGNSSYSGYIRYSESGSSSNYAYFGYTPSGDDDRGLYIALDNNVDNATTQDWALFARSYGDSVQGSSYVYYDTRGGLYADQYWCARNQHYTFGVAGYWYDSDDGYANRCGGVFGAAEMADYWASLGYRNSGNNEYGLYYTSSSNGSGLLRSTPEGDLSGVREGIGMGGYGDLLGGWTRGEIYGMNVKGERYSLYIDGATFSNTPYAVLNDVGEDERIPTFVNTSTDVSVMTSGVGRLENGYAYITLDKNFCKLISRNIPLVITVTPIGRPISLYVSSWDYKGFSVAEVGDGHSSGQFSWIVVGRRDGYAEEPFVPEEILRQDYDEKMSEVMFNENDLNNSARQIWWDGEKLRFDPMPPKPNNTELERQKKLMEKNEPGYNDNVPSNSENK